MNNIELTKEHQDKLLEMIKKLFPEFVKIEFCIDSSDYCQDEYEKCLRLFTYFTGDGQTYSEIHWFEFCIMDLTTKIYNLRQPSTTITLMRGHIVQDGHPVDLLYEQFKLIK